MRPFMDEEFLLSTETAKKLYHEVAEQLPIIDYHCHISPKEIYEDRRFDTITQVWLGGDHYKWRTMRANGATEDLVTGDASDRDKFRAFAAVMPKLIGNPLYHWSHLELKRYFGITTPLSPDTADAIYDEVNEKLKGWSARRFMAESNVKAICTTDDPIDDLQWHKKMAADPTMPARVLAHATLARAFRFLPSFTSTGRYLYNSRMASSANRSLTGVAQLAMKPSAAWKKASNP